MVQLPTFAHGECFDNSPPSVGTSFSGHRPEVPGQESAKTKPTTTDRHTFQETDCGGKQQNRPCLHFGSPSQPSSWSFPRPQFFMLWTNPARPELTPGTPWMRCTRTRSWSNATSAHASTTARRSFSTCSKAFPMRCTSCRTKAQVCNFCGSLWIKEMHQWIESLEIAPLLDTCLHIDVPSTTTSSSSYVDEWSYKLSLDAIRSRNVTATGLKRNGRRRSIRCGHISEQSFSSGCYANVWPVSTIIIIYNNIHIYILWSSQLPEKMHWYKSYRYPTDPTDIHRSYMPCLGVLGTDWGCWRQRCKHWWPLRWARPPLLKPHLRVTLATSDGARCENLQSEKGSTWLNMLQHGSTWFNSRPRITMIYT